MLVKSPGFTFVAVVALALGIGANTAIFSVVNAVLLRPLPFVNAEQLVKVYGGRARGGTGYTPVSYPDFADYKKQAQSFDRVASYSLAGTTLMSGGDEPERLDGAVVSAELFPMLDAKPALGRVFSAEEDQPGAAPVIVLSYGLWQRRFNSDPKISGQEIKIGGRTATVLGVMPAGFKFPVQADRVDYWSPLSSDPGIAPLLTARGMRFLPVIASLKPNVTLRQAEAEMNTIASRLAAQYPATNTGGSVHLESLHEDLVGDIRPALLVLLGAVGFVLLIACANVANLSLARAAARSKEIAIRTALGASRMRVVRQLLTESLLLSLCGGAVGLMLAVWGVDLLVAASPPDIPRLAEIGIDGRVLLFTLGVSILTGIVFGIAPALQISKHDLNESLKEGDRGSTEGLRRNRVRGLLVVSEVALSLMLLVGAGLLIKSFLHLLETDPGYDTERVLAADIALARTKYPEPDQQAVFFQQAIQRVAALPGVEAVGATTLLPLGGSDTRISFNIEGHPPFPRGETPAARYQIASPDYFRVMNIPLHKGRSFTEQDAKDSPPVVIVSEAFARRFFADEDPIGKRVLIDTVAENPPPSEIIGVVGDVRHGGLDAKTEMGFYVSYLQSPARNMELVVRSRSIDPALLSSDVRGAIKEIDKNQLIWEMRTMSRLVAQSVAPRRFNMLLLGAFAFVALVLAIVGIYGVMAYTVTQRTHEIGIRLALGAQTTDVLRLIVTQGMMLALVGVGIGLAGAFATTRLMRSLLYGVSATDPLIFFGVSLLLAFVALVACYIPARRAMRVDPMVALRYE